MFSSNTAAERSTTHFTPAVLIYRRMMRELFRWTFRLEVVVMEQQNFLLLVPVHSQISEGCSLVASGAANLHPDPRIKVHLCAFLLPTLFCSLNSEMCIELVNKAYIYHIGTYCSTVIVLLAVYSNI